MRRFLCQTPDCGAPKRRTELGTVRPYDGPLLIVPPDAEVRPEMFVWRIRCPVCGEESIWYGHVARKLRAA